MADDLPIKVFASQETWERWLDRNHAKAEGVWLKFAKKASRKRTVTYPDALDVALCYGWIDGQTRGLDEDYHLQRFTPRRARSKWSKINREKVTRLIEQGRMRPAGLAEIERAKVDVGGTPPTTARARSSRLRSCSRPWMRTRRRKRSSSSWTARTATRSSTESRTRSAQRPVRGGSRRSSRC